MSEIQWTDVTWNPIRGCAKVSPGCARCYAERTAARFRGPGLPYEGLVDERGRWTGRARFVPEKLAEPLRWRKPRRVFVNSMSDLFHADVTNEQIAAVFGVMAACPQHTFQVLTKRPQRMLSVLSEPAFPRRVERFKHIALANRIEEFFAEERLAPVRGYPNLFVTSRGRALTARGSSRCLWCRAKNDGMASRKYCSKECRSKAHYEQKMGRWSPPSGDLAEMRAHAGEHGHRQIPMTQHGGTQRPGLVHRLVLEHFDRSPRGGEVACHIDGDPSNNALWNLRWGTSSDNTQDRIRHGNGRTWSKITPDEADEIRERFSGGESIEKISKSPPLCGRITATQVSNIVHRRQWRDAPAPEWPLPMVHLLVSVEDQPTADERIPLLLRCPAAVRGVSYEPALGPVDFEHLQPGDPPTEINALRGTHGVLRPHRGNCDRLDWVIAGSESGPRARPAQWEWFRNAKTQCAAAGVPFFFKQWVDAGRKTSLPVLDGERWEQFPEVSHG